MKIALIGNPPIPLDNPFYREIERLNMALASGLEQRGHRVSFYDKGSPDKNEWRAILGSDHLTEISRLKAKANLAQPELEKIISKALLEVMKKIDSEGYDLIHNSSIYVLPLLASTRMKTPMLTTLHQPPTSEFIHLLKTKYNEISSQFACSSIALRELWKKEFKDLDMAVVETYGAGAPAPIPLSINSSKRKLTWFGPINSMSGLKQAIEASHLCGLHLNIYGEVIEKAYFEKEVLPLLGKMDKYYINPTQEEKQNILSKSVGAIPSNIFGLKSSSELALALRIGIPLSFSSSFPMKSLVGHTEATVASGDSPHEIAKAICELKKRNSLTIRKRASERFHINKVIEKYEGVYNFLKVMHERDIKTGPYWNLH